MPGSRRASIVLPDPGGPTINRLWCPAAAISSARRAAGWPHTSRRSGPAGGGSGRAAGTRRGIGLPGKDLHRLVEVVGREHRNRLGQAGLDGVLGGYQQPLQALPAGRLGDRDGALNRPQPAVQTELGSGADAAHGGGLDLTAGGQDRERDCQVESGSLLALASRRQVDRDPLRREAVRGGLDPAAHALARLLDGPVGQPHHRERGRRAALDVGLDVDAAGIDARDPEAGRRRDHAATLRRRGARVGDGTCRNRRGTATCPSGAAQNAAGRCRTA